MTNKSLIFAGIFATILGNNAFATGENTVTSKSYVDAQDALKQNKIPVAGTNAETLGESVVTYTDTAGTIGERGIYTGKGKVGAGDLITVDVVAGGSGTVAVRDENGMPTSSRNIYDGSTTYNAQNDANDLITAGAVQGQINGITNDINNINTNISNVNNQITSIASQPLTPVTVQLPLTCANENDGCTLWQIGGTDVAHKLTSCTTATVATDCPACVSGTIKTCTNNVCACTADIGLPVIATTCVPGNRCSTNADCGTGICVVSDTANYCRCMQN